MKKLVTAAAFLLALGGTTVITYANQKTAEE